MAGPIALNPLMRLESTQEEEEHDRTGALRLPEIRSFGRSPSRRASVALLPQRLGEKPRQRLGFRGLDQVMVKAHFARLVPTFGLSPSGQRDQNDVFAPWL